MFAIDIVVGSHDGPRLTLFHGNLKCLQVQLTKGTWSGTGIRLLTQCFCLISGKVLDTGSYTVILYATDIGSSQFSGKEGVLGHIFLVTATQCGTLQVDGWTQDDIQTPLFHLIANQVTHLAYGIHIESGSHGSRGRSGGTAIVEMVEITIACHVHPVRAIGQVDGRNSQTRHRIGPSGNTWKFHIRIGPSGTGTCEHVHFFIVGQCSDNLIDIVCTKLLCFHYHRHRQGSQKRKRDNYLVHD